MTVGIFKELGILWDFELKKETEEIYLLFIFLNDKNIYLRQQNIDKTDTLELSITLQTGVQLSSL